MNKTEPDFKRHWVKKHNSADEIVVNAETKELVAAIYYYPPAQDEAEQKKIWRAVATQMELEKLERSSGI